MEAQKGLGLEDYSMFTSPWARTFEDEQFFTDTTSTVGQVRTPHTTPLYTAHVLMLVSSLALM